MTTVRRIFESSALRYLGVGGTAFVVDFGATVIATDVLLLPLWLAVAIGFFAGFVVNFALQRNFAFKTDRPYVWSVVLYVLLVLFNWAATTLGMYIIVEWLNYPTALGKSICTILTTLWNYPLYRFIIFPKKKPPHLLGPSVPIPERIDYVIPAHNSASLLEGTIKELASWSRGSGIAVHAIIVENGSQDNTAQVSRDLEANYQTDTLKITVTTSDIGLGNAYRRGIELTTAELVILSADDLPFGTSDIEAWLRTPNRGLAIGSKAHEDSQVDRGLARAIVSAGFRVLRALFLHSKLGDPQGTLLADGTWLRQIAPECRENGYLSSTEIVAIAEAQVIPIAELPVILTPRQDDHHTRIHLQDVYQMALGLVRIRKRCQAVAKRLSVQS